MGAKAQKAGLLEDLPEKDNKVATVTPLVQAEEEDTQDVSVGQHLRKKRTSLKKRLPDISRTLRISETYLKAIEEDRGEDLPERVYAVGFVRSYSQFLGLDPQETTKRFCEEVLASPQRKNYHLPISYSPKNTPSRRVLKVCLLLAFVLMAGWLVFEGRYSTFFSSKWENKNPPSPISVTAEPAGESPLTQKSSSQEISTDKEVYNRLDEKEVPEIDEGVEEYARQIKERKATLSEVTPEKASEVLPQKIETSAKKVLSSEQVPFKLSFKGESWVEIRQSSDDKVVVRKTFSLGDSYEVPQEEGLVMKVGNASAIVFLKGEKESRPLGDKGQVLSGVSLDAKDIASFF